MTKHYTNPAVLETEKQTKYVFWLPFQNRDVLKQCQLNQIKKILFTRISTYNHNNVLFSVSIGFVVRIHLYITYIILE